MGLFDFVSTVGKKLGIDYFEQQDELKKLDQEADRLQKEKQMREKLGGDITAAVNALSLSISGFNAHMKGQTAVLSGSAQSQSDKEKAILCAGNFAGVNQVDDGGFSVVVPEPPAMFHNVVKGDTLSLIAQRYYGIIMAFEKIGEANQPMIANVDQISPGWIIRIPPIEGIYYTTKKGDTLGAIAKTMYGDVQKYKFLFEKNQATLTSPDVVTPGMSLFIPILHDLPAGTSGQPNA
jgi:LysM repeat protein